MKPGCSRDSAEKAGAMSKEHCAVQRWKKGGKRETNKNGEPLPVNSAAVITQNQWVTRAALEFKNN